VNIHLITKHTFREYRRQNALTQAEQVLPRLPESKADHRYAEGKWTVKEKLQHVIDTERIMAYRALTIAREDTTPLPGFDENSYAQTANVAHRSLKDLGDELIAVRKTTLYLFRSFDQTAFGRIGQANKNPVSVLGLAYIIAGHQRHHFAILQERYFPEMQL
jgi:hypothetical protein